MSSGGVGERRPNIVVILADDMGWGDLGCYGAERIPTPAMDRVAGEGMRALDCHSAAALCTPSALALIEGESESLPAGWGSPSFWRQLS